MADDTTRQGFIPRDGQTEGTLTRYAGLRRGLMFMAEAMQTVILYLGIAVFVSMVVSFSIPSLRDQSAEFHGMLLSSIRSDPAADVAVYVPRSERRASLAAPSRFIASLAEAANLPVPGLTAAQDQALRAYIGRKYKIAEDVAGSLIRTAFEVGAEKALDPQLLLAVIAIESRYNPFAESHVGAQGLMQVMTRVHKDKFEQFAGKEYAAIDPRANIQVGAQILHDCIRRRGSIEGGLACYVGATGPGDGGYGAKVLAERRRIALASGIPLRD